VPLLLFLFFSKPKIMVKETKLESIPKIFGNVDGQTGFRCIKGGKSWSIVKNAA
jgi:hypothetical protein